MRVTPLGSLIRVIVDEKPLNLDKTTSYVLHVLLLIYVWNLSWVEFTLCANVQSRLRKIYIYITLFERKNLASIISHRLKRCPCKSGIAKNFKVYLFIFLLTFIKYSAFMTSKKEFFKKRKKSKKLFFSYF